MTTQEYIEPTEQQIADLTALARGGLNNGRVIPIGNLSYQEWLILRSIVGIGASEIAAVLGYAPPFFSNTPLSVWKEKVSHIIKLIDNPTLRIGRNVEEAIVQEYEYLTGRKVLRVKDKMFLHQKHDFLFTDLDGIILPAGGDGYGILEAKSTVSYVYESWKTKLPTYYFRQSMGELSVMDGSEYNPEYVEFATLILDKREVEVLRINKDGEFIEQQNQELEEWYNKYVVENVPPPESVSEWAKTEPMSDSFIEADDKTYQYYLDLKRVQAEKKAIEEDEKVLKDKLIEAIKDNEYLTYNGDIIASYKQQSRISIDSKKLKAQKPEIFDEFKKTTTFRVLLPKQLEVINY